jgi:hypothetical protein
VPGFEPQITAVKPIYRLLRVRILFACNGPKTADESRYFFISPEEVGRNISETLVPLYRTTIVKSLKTAIFIMYVKIIFL